MRQVIEVDGVSKELFELSKQNATNSYFEEKRHKYRAFDGYLEKVIERKLPAYDDLVWKNFFYGRVKKYKIKDFRFRMSSKNPTHSLYREVFETLNTLVDFPKAIRELYKS